MAKRDNPRLKERESEKQQKKEDYFKQKKTRENGGGQRSRDNQEYGGRREPVRNRDNSENRGARGRADGGRPQGSRGPGSSLPRGEWQEERQEDPNLIIGRNPVMEAIKSGRQIDKLVMQKDSEGSARKIAAMARERKIQIQYVERVALDRMCPGRPHQGVAAYGTAHDYVELEEILEKAKALGEDPFIIILDGLEDPHNLGAIMRTADAAGAHGIVIPSRRAVGLTETVAKASAGAIEYVPVAKVGNIVSAIEELKKAGLWIAGCDMEGQTYYEAELTGPMGIVVGGEGQGVSRLVREKCDYILSIPMKGKISSLNASNAAAVLMYEVYRKRCGVKQEG